MASSALAFTEGYCQSMNFVAYYLLACFLFHDNPKIENTEDSAWLQDKQTIHEAEVKSFYVFESLLCIAGEYHAKTLLRTISDTIALEFLIRDFIPTVYHHFRTLGGKEIAFLCTSKAKQRSECCFVCNSLVYDFVFYYLKFFGLCASFRLVMLANDN